MVKFVLALVCTAAAAGLPFILYGCGEPMGSCEIEEKRETELESYVIGVVAGEMPTSFPREALKAQAVAARTYAYRAMLKSGAEYASTQQSYLTVEQMQKKWGKEFINNYNLISEAVRETEGEILIYRDEPALTVFCSSVAGHTRDSGEVWVQRLPYLMGTVSVGDENAPNFISAKIVKADELKRLIGSDNINIVSRDSAGYVKEAEVGKGQMTGEELRSALGLRSAAFKIERDGDRYIFVTRGYGHGVGMSQYGAAEMAKQGKSYREILKHYYNGTEIKALEK